MKQYVMHTDGGHGWLAVKRTELAELGILNDISKYSYQRGQTVYLEEDSDLYKFLLVKYQGEDDFQGALQMFFVTIRYSNTGTNRSPVRNYEGFTNV